MKCINKNDPKFKSLVRHVGEDLAEQYTRWYTKKMGSVEFVIPDFKKDLIPTIRESKESQFQELAHALNVNPFLPKETIISYLKGVIHNYKGNMMVTRGDAYGGMVYQTAREELMLKPNTMIVKSLERDFPDIFTVDRTKNNNLRLNITPRIMSPETKYSLSISELIQLKPINDKYNRDLDQYIKNPSSMRGHTFELGVTSSILQSIGVPRQRIILQEPQIDKELIATTHDFELSDLHDLVKNIHNPVMVFKATSPEARIEAMEFVSELENKDGRRIHVIFTLNLSAQGLKVTKITTAFVPQNLKRIYAKFQNKQVLYVDKNRVNVALRGYRSKPDMSYRDKDIDSESNINKIIEFTKNFVNPISDNDARFQKAIAEGNENQLVTQEQIDSAKAELKKILPKVPVEIVDDYINVVYNSDAKAVGKFENALITLSKRAKDITVIAKHEAFHAVFDILKTINPSLYEEVLDEASKKYGIERGVSNATVKYSVKQENEINYAFKAIDNIQNNIDKVVKWYSDNNIDFWKKLQTDLQIPKQQIELLQETYKNLLNKARIGIPSNKEFIEEMLSDFAANYSYTIEINTTKQKYSAQNTRNQMFDLGIFDDEEDDPEDDIWIDRMMNESAPNTSHYSNLTVPGGTNYTENEIATPAIYPSIKGHAQFSTANGIGWFRSDDKAEGQNLISKEEQEALLAEARDIGSPEMLESVLGKGKATKTRRILELQSDLFQKGRDKEFLTVDRKRQVVTNEGVVNLSNRINPESLKQNQFLQLLNKDNNWVTFFIKSIIQDSAKKGYEKVLFPTGNTASKVEGHSTLEEFKKQKEDRIKELEKQKATDFYQETEGKFAGMWLGKDKPYKDKRFAEASFDNEINQLKQELERVEREGFGALKPIYNFYENTVANILKKQGFNPEITSDEYGNTWYEINLNTLPKTLIDNIRLSSPDIQYSGDLAIEERLADDFSITKSDVPTTAIGKFFQWIKNFIKGIVGNKSKVDKLFTDINQGKFANYSVPILDQAISIVNSDVVQGFSAIPLRDAANNNLLEFREMLSNIADQASDSRSVNATVRTYGQELVDIALELNNKTIGEQKSINSNPEDLPPLDISC